MEPPENLASWLALIIALLTIGGLTMAGVRGIVRVEVRTILDREFANGKPPSAKEYQPLRAVVDRLDREMSRLVTLISTHTHDEDGEVRAPIVAREGERV